MHRLLALLLVVLLAGASVAPAAEAQVAPAPILPPESSVMVPPHLAPAAAPQALTRLGTLRIRAIGLSVNLYQWTCRDSGIPNRALRWRCSGANNQFVFGHAYGVFHPYYLAWARHKLKAGVVALYTDRHGRVTRYKLTWARKVPRSYIWKGLTGERWAWSATSRPAITLQTCWGPTNAYRIITRFTKG
jgi:hypothetical protein